MTDGTSSGSTPDESDPWLELLADATAVEREFRDAGWETVLVEPDAVTPIETDDRVGIRATVAQNRYAVLEDLVERDDIAFSAVDVYYQTDGQTMFVLAVERDDESHHAVLVPLYYDLPDASAVLQTALAEGNLSIYLDPADEPEAEAEPQQADESEAPDEDRWVVFSHDDPSLFVESVDELEE
ncbi:hypothetical protein EL22_19355 [Halostagnicola sp. A56]|uniref:DUF7529 family protein n=1 Tax=Halostagnicola sp. A56 TaxID=1495067 RepID=UPI00049EAAEE|nr:hypothetical protein [Halostagnicola sp. A56]KDE59629.1 hypothetical protein EL22_19355 [Halostagnicola sp. A56]